MINGSFQVAKYGVFSSVFNYPDSNRRSTVFFQKVTSSGEDVTRKTRGHFELHSVLNFNQHQTCSESSCCVHSSNVECIDLACLVRVCRLHAYNMHKPLPVLT